MLDGSLHHTRDASASPGFLLAEWATPYPSRLRNGDRYGPRGPPRCRRCGAVDAADRHPFHNYFDLEGHMSVVRIQTFIVGVVATALASVASAVVVPPAGYIYTTQ